jgi:hypothetical protein
MSQQIRVEKSLQFKDFATIGGNPSFTKNVIYDDFLGAALDAGRWVFAGDNGGTEAITVAQGGTVTLTTGATDNDRSLLASPLNFLCSKNPVIEARIKVSAATTVGLNFGFNDATTEGNDALAAEITGVALTNAKSTDFVGFVYDTDGTNDFWHVAATKADTEGTPVLAKAVGQVMNGTTRVDPAPLKINAGSNSVTVGVGTFLIELPGGAYGTATQGTATVTGSPVSLTPGINTITTTDGGTVTIVHGLVPSTTFHTLRVELDTSGNATFYHDGVAVGRLAACVTTTAPLCAFLGVIARTTSARVLTVDYIKAWQDR